MILPNLQLVRTVQLSKANFKIAEENSAKSYCFRGFKCLISSSHKMGSKCEMATGPVVVVRLGYYLGLKSRGGCLPPVESAGPAESCLLLPDPRRFPTSKPNCAAIFAEELCPQFRKLSKSENFEGCVTILPNPKLVRTVQLSKANFKIQSNLKDWLRVIGWRTYLCRFVKQPD